MLKKISILMIIINLICIPTCYCSDEIDLDKFISSMEKYSGEIIDVKEASNNLMQGKGIDKGKIFSKIINIFILEIKNAIKNSYSIFFIIILVSIIKSIGLDLDEGIKKISLISFTLMISLICIKIFLDILKIFKSSITLFISALQIAVPFLMTLLIVTGKITTTSIIGPSILFSIQCIGYLVEAVVIPFSILSLVFTIICGINEKINLTGLIKVFNKTSLTTLSVMFGIFLFILALETNISVSIDGIYEKTLQNAANFVPVVGKFVSESLEVVLGSFVLIKKVAGTITIVLLAQIMLVPILKIISIIIVFNILIIFTQIIASDEKKIIDILGKFLDTYKFLFGMLVSISGLFIISIGIIITISGNIKM